MALIHNPKCPYIILQHARWHCLYGSTSQDRIATKDDADAAQLILDKMGESRQNCLCKVADD